MTQEERRTQTIIKQVLEFYEDFYGVTYEVVKLDTYVLYLDGDIEIGRVENTNNYGLGYILSAILNIINEKVLTYD